MTEFDSSRWSDPEFVQEYLDNAEAYVPFRQAMLGFLRSFYLQFVKGDEPARVLDLGCGDGILTDVILGVDPGVRATLVDGAEEMLDKAVERFSGKDSIVFVRSSFQDIMKNNPLPSDFDLVMSSLAIHHLEPDQKEALFGYIYRCLAPGGYFVNIDAIAGPTPELEDWYMELWKEWVEKQKRSGRTHQDFSDITRRYKENEDNRPDTLEFQLESLKRTGFDQVDCYYKLGIFAIFGGRKY